MAGKFYPFEQYNNDLTRSFTGLCHVYPSKCMTIKLDDAADLDTVLKRMNAKAEQQVNGDKLNYSAIRDVLYYYTKSLVDPDSIPKNDGAKDGTISAPSVSDINFLSHEPHSGSIYYDIYVSVTPEQGKRYVIPPSGSIDEPGKDPVELSGFDAWSKEFADTASEQFESTRKDLTFDALILYYDCYVVDPTYATADAQVIIKDMPLGLYVLDEEQTIHIKDLSIYGQGTSWATRICSRLTTNSTRNLDVDPTRINEYSTLTKVLQEFGRSSQIINEYIKEDKSKLNQDSKALTPADIKAYLEEFRNQSKVNVPYIKNNHWYVNGRDLGEVVVKTTIDDGTIQTIKTDIIKELQGSSVDISEVPREVIESWFR